MGGITKHSTVFTTAGCCAKTDFQHSKQKQKQRWSQLKRTKGSVSLSFTLPNSGVPFTFVGSHLDTKDPFDGMRAIKESMPIPKGGVQVRRGHALWGG